MRLTFLILVLPLGIPAFAQTDSTSNGQDTTVKTVSTVGDTALMQGKPLPGKTAVLKKTYPKNVVKFTVTSLLFKNYNFVFERSLTRKISASLAYRTMPVTLLSQLPALKEIYKLVGENENTLNEDWNDRWASNKTITAGFRFYGGRKPGPRGFYLGVYGRYAKFDVDYNYIYEGATQNYLIPIKATARGIGGGFYTGVQWLIAKRVAIDWQIIGSQWGKLSGNGTGAADLSTLSKQDQENLKQDLEDILPAIGNKKTITAEVTSTGAHLNVSGPFIGIRSAICVGISF